MSTDPARRAIEKIATADSDKEVTLREASVATRIPLPKGEEITVSASFKSARIRKDNR